MNVLTIKRVDEEHHRSMALKENKIVNSPEEITIKKSNGSIAQPQIRRVN